MKYVVAWEVRANATEELQDRSLQVFGKWSPDPQANFTEFVGRIDGRGGFAVVESDDPRTVARDMALFGPFFEFSVYPVLDIGESSQIAGEAVATRQSIT